MIGLNEQRDEVTLVAGSGAPIAARLVDDAKVRRQQWAI